ncbi:hypothetical protein N9E97_00535 [Planktomarina sp.]|nr:hypothetical protein [Planktomarina sp.]
MADNNNNEEILPTIDELNIDPSGFSGEAKALYDCIKFVDDQVLQKNNELQIADSARIMYLSVLKTELSQTSE